MSQTIYENTDVANYLWEHWCRKLLMRIFIRILRSEIIY